VLRLYGLICVAAVILSSLSGVWADTSTLASMDGAPRRRTHQLLQSVC